MAKPPVRRTAASSPAPSPAKRGQAGPGARGAAAQAAAAQQMPKPRPAGKNATLLVSVIAMAALAIFERPIAILVILAMVPSMIAWLVDETPALTLLRTVAPLNMASVLPFAIKLALGRNSLAQVFVLLSASSTWIGFYGAAMFGWIVYYTAPAVISVVQHRRIERRREALIARQAALKDEWGEEVMS